VRVLRIPPLEKIVLVRVFTPYGLEAFSICDKRCPGYVTNPAEVAAVTHQSHVSLCQIRQRFK